MKYIITESQINKIIYNYLNNKNFYHLDYDGNNYLVERKTDDYAFVKFEPRYGWCSIADELVKEVKMTKRGKGKDVIEFTGVIKMSTTDQVIKNGKRYDKKGKGDK